MSRVLVTGATGFVGGAYAHHLRRNGHEVVALVRAVSARSARVAELEADGVEVQVFDGVGDLPAAVVRSRPQRVAHLATLYLKGHTAADVVPLIDANVTFGTVLLEALAGSGAVVVSASSFVQYRHGAPHPYSLYSATKEAFGSVIAFYRERRSLDVRELILYDTYGPRDVRPKLIPAMLDSLVDGRELRVGSPLQRLHLVHVDDVCRAIDAASAEGAAERSAARLAHPVTVGEIIAVVDDLSRGRARIAPDGSARPDDTPVIAGDWPAPPGWSAEIALRVGLAPLVGAAIESLS